MSYHVPFYIFGQSFVFGTHFLDFVFPENTLPGAIRLQNIFRRFGFRYGDESCHASQGIFYRTYVFFYAHSANAYAYFLKYKGTLLTAKMVKTYVKIRGGL